MKVLPENIKDFILANQIASVCFVDENKLPYCINCFFAVDKENKLIVFKSSTGTRHHNHTIEKTQIAGTILPEKIEKLKIRGVQFTATILSNEELISFNCSATYYKQYPFALAMPGYIWGAKFEFIKFTDNTLGFGNKTIWPS
jgi:uncharacterized protein YhbP (UPF0306 family)